MKDSFDSIVVSSDYPNSKGVVRLVGLLGKGSDVLPLRLWCYIGKHYGAKGGRMVLTAQEIEVGIAWWGEDGVAVKALAQSEFLIECEGGYQVAEWERLQELVFMGVKKAKHAALSRWIDSKDRRKMLEQCSSIARASANDEHGAVVLSFPVVSGKYRTTEQQQEIEYNLREDKLQEYVESFPGVNVPEQLRQARQWCIDNPARRKTLVGMPRFLFQWLCREQNRGSFGRTPAQQGFDWSVDSPVKKVIEGWRRITGSHSDKSWYPHIANVLKSQAQSLLDYFGCDYVKAVDCAQDVYEELKNKGLECSLRTVLARAPEWKTRRENYGRN